jgi:DMSO reductase anchor subunit
MSMRDRTIIFGVLIGAATGLAAAMLLNRRAAEGNGTTQITTGEGLKLGVMVVGLLRAVASLGEENDKK